MEKGDRVVFRDAEGEKRAVVTNVIGTDVYAALDKGGTILADIAGFRVTDLPERPRPGDAKETWLIYADILEDAGDSDCERWRDAYAIAGDEIVLQEKFDRLLMHHVWPRKETNQRITLRQHDFSDATFQCDAISLFRTPFVNGNFETRRKRLLQAVVSNLDWHGYLLNPMKTDDPKLWQQMHWAMPHLAEMLVWCYRPVVYGLLSESTFLDDTDSASVYFITDPSPMIRSPWRFVTADYGVKIVSKNSLIRGSE